jgi:hypothetical protein
MKGLEDVSIQPFVGIANMRKIVKLQSDKLQAGDSDQQYLIFRPVRKDDLAKIDRARHSIGKHIRMAHYTDTNLLIVKLMPSPEHEAAHVNLVKRLDRKLGRIGMPDDEFYGLGAAQFYGHNSSKEGDSVYKPLSSRGNKTDWPTIVFESGLSESLLHLRSDAKWWLENSEGDVNIVIVISIKPVQSMLQIEKWELAPVAGRRPSTRAVPNNPNIPPPQIPTKTQEITIIPNTVTGAPLVLEFEKIFLRPAVLPESDIIFTGQELSDWAANFWQGLR